MVSFMKIKLKSLLMWMREEKYCLTPVKVSLQDDGTEGRFIFPMQSFLLPVSISSAPPKHTCQSGGWLALHRRQLVSLPTGRCCALRAGQ